METIIIMEKKKSITTDVILVAIFAVVPLFFLIKWLILADEGLVFIIFFIVVTLFFPSVVISGYIWDVRQKIVLTKSGITLHFGRNIIDIMHWAGSFSIRPHQEVFWTEIDAFQIDAYECRESVEGGGYSTFMKYNLLIQIKNKDKVVFNFEKFSPKYYTISLTKFKETPNEILEICERFLQNIK